MQDLELDNFFFDDSLLKSDMSKVNLSGLTGGKHLRSRLLYLTGQLFELDDKTLTSLGRIAELVHNATLTHDDVIDNSHTRRNVPSVPALIGNKKSVLLGDYMLARALFETAEFDNSRLTQELTLALKDLVEGEWIQYENTNPYEISAHLYETLALKKTGALFRWGFIAPALQAGNTILLNDLAAFGNELGILFQMADDLIDFNKESRKSYGLDFRNNNINYVLHFVGNDYPQFHKKFLQTEDINELSKVEIDAINASLDKAKKEMKIKFDLCHTIINTIESKLPSVKPAHSETLKNYRDLLTLIFDRVF